MVFSNVSISLTFCSFKKEDLKRKFLFFNRMLFSFARISSTALSIKKFNTLISLLRSPFVHKKSFEQFFYTFYNCTLTFFYRGLGSHLLVDFIHCFLLDTVFKRFILKTQLTNKSTFFF